MKCQGWWWADQKFRESHRDYRRERYWRTDVREQRRRYRSRPEVRRRSRASVAEVLSALDGPTPVPELARRLGKWPSAIRKVAKTCSSLALDGDVIRIKNEK